MTWYESIRMQDLPRTVKKRAPTDGCSVRENVCGLSAELVPHDLLGQVCKPCLSAFQARVRQAESRPRPTSTSILAPEEKEKKRRKKKRKL